jgi:DNA polymerase I-like protein with 3'-5' exonuclease and polymerase domains
MFKGRITLLWESNGKSWIPGIDGRRVHTRQKHSVVNSAFQSCGAIAMDYSALFMDKWLGGITLDKEGVPCYLYRDCSVYRVGYFHDELIWEVPEHLANEIGEMGVKSIESAGRMLKMRVPLTGDYKVGMSWADIH